MREGSCAEALIEGEERTAGAGVAAEACFRIDVEVFKEWRSALCII